MPLRCSRRVGVRFLAMPARFQLRRALVCQSKPLLCSGRPFSVLQFIAFAGLRDAYLALPLRVKALLCRCVSLLRRALAVHFVSWRIHAVAKPRLVPRSDAFASRCHAIALLAEPCLAVAVAVPCVSPNSCAIALPSLASRLLAWPLPQPRIASYRSALPFRCVSTHSSRCRGGADRCYSIAALFRS